VNDTGKYNNIFLVGFSLGGNLMLKYLGEKRNHKQPSNIKKGVVFSVPLDLYGSCLKISEGLNGIYGWRFVQKLKIKIRQKAALFPDQFNLNELKNIRGLIDFDNRFTAPIHGFTNAMDYYQRCSALQFVQDISIPVLIVNALNDPFLSDSCYPKKISGTNPKVQVLTPAQGGHCGFADRNFNNHYWSEVLAWNYLKRSD
jgi:predicted alpha/beta-fold hydrolase